MILSITSNNFQYDISLRKFDYDSDISYLSSLEKDKLLLSEGVAREFILTINGLSKTTLFPEHIDNKHFPFIAFGLGYDEHLVNYYL